MKVTVEKLKEMIREAVMLTAIEPSLTTKNDSGSLETPGMFPGMSDTGLSSEKGSVEAPSCDDTSSSDLKDVVKTMIANVVTEQVKKDRKKNK